MYTIQQCKQDMIEIWSELARTGADRKPLKFKHLAHSCPCCEYSFMHNHWGCCRDCPVDEWRTDSYNNKTCERYGEYGEWMCSCSELDRQYWANKILIKAYMIRSKSL